MLFEKTAIVTGAASGIGYAVAQALRQEGAQVVIGANDQYIGLCRKHWMLGDLGPDFNGQGTGD